MKYFFDMRRLISGVSPSQVHRFILEFTHFPVLSKMGIFSCIRPRRAKQTHVLDPTSLPAVLPLPPGLSLGAADYRDPLQMGIAHHEAGRLDVATYLFSVSASQGDSMGLFLLGTSLRLGFGVQADEAAGFRCLMQAADCAVGDLGLLELSPNYQSQPRPSDQKRASLDKQSQQQHHQQSLSSFLSSISDAGVDPVLTSSTTTTTPNPGNQLAGLSRKQLKTLAHLTSDQFSLYLLEISHCFKQGSGTKKSTASYLYFLTVSAELGDPDAMFELGECYLRGKGVKKSRNEASRWIRKSERRRNRIAKKAGRRRQDDNETWGIAWVWKSKFDQYDDDLLAPCRPPSSSTLVN